MSEVRGGRTASALMLTSCGVWLVGLGVCFAVLRPPLLPEDVRFMGATAVQLRETLPGVERWLRLVFTVMGGFMAGSGVLTLFIAAQLQQTATRWRASAIGLAGVLTVVVIGAVNFTLGSDFRWLLLVPAVAWMGAFLLHRTGR